MSEEKFLKGNQRSFEHEIQELLLEKFIAMNPLDYIEDIDEYYESSTKKTQISLESLNLCSTQKENRTLFSTISSY